MRHPLLRAAALGAVMTASLGAQAATEPGVQAHLFANFDYSDTQRPMAEGFKLGQVAGHIAWGLSDRVTFFSEATLSGSATGYTPEVERVLLRYDVRDWLRLSAGRVHTPLGYWNTSYHHGQWMQTTIARPELVRGGNALVPLHFVGVVAEGTLHGGPAVFGYAAGVGNGRGTTISRGGDAGDANNSRARVASATVRVPHLAGLRLGTSYYADRLTPSAAFDVAERTVAGHVALERESPEVIVEYARIRHTPRKPTQPPSNSASWYSQLGYRLPGAAHDFKPYVRLEHSAIAGRDTILTPLKLNFDGVTGGVRYDVLPNAALKVEYRSERIERGIRQRTIAASLSFMLSGHAGGQHPDPLITETPSEHHAVKSDSTAVPRD